MATAVSIGLFSDMLDERLRNNGKRLDFESIALLDRMQDEWSQARAHQLGVDISEIGSEVDSERTLSAVDSMTSQLILAAQSDQDVITVAELRSVLSFFCPGLPPIC